MSLLAQAIAIDEFSLYLENRLNKKETKKQVEEPIKEVSTIFWRHQSIDFVELCYGLYEIKAFGDAHLTTIAKELSKTFNIVAPTDIHRRWLDIQKREKGIDFYVTSMGKALQNRAKRE